MSPEAFFTMIIWILAAMTLTISMFGLFMAAALAAIWVTKAKQ